MNIRRASQAYFAVFYLAAGYLFYTVVQAALAGQEGNFSYRFPAIEAFLPISALVGLKQFLVTGDYDPVHPAGLSILLIAMLSALALKRGVCSHICPVGTAHEMLDGMRRKMIKRPVSLPRALHYLFMLPKYLALGFFIYVILIGMSGNEAAAFVVSPYNVIADAKMLYFFLNPSANTVAFIVCITLISLAVPFFWCRYLCPYGALLNIFAVISPLSIKRDGSNCSACKICDQNCPAGLRVSAAGKMVSPDCVCCHKCITACPTKALTLNTALSSKPLPPAVYSKTLLALFIAGIAIAKAGGLWHSPALTELWYKYLPLMPKIGHP